ncbi:MAG: ABC transporter ATP-binding protein [Armatimonadota bacterium]|nr:ABC transporter ATP-binding protein [Armatimonadota bacterium]MDR7451672.1 ABC transporter ATP-binding protein [Armatimonadota bacterium]MDR7465710.1 ABC transporter ATP-binding protein [Armatimonadota bacterium]MDR7493619.1 ABC transporter ATP-binding protein [Armatimonadota bacterium]MDR7499133.1 ABC transporter ATP-binding protein [Armatimonadota bacterium]
MSPRLRAYLWRHRRSYAVGFLLSIVAALLVMINPVLVRLAIDGIARGVPIRQLALYALGLVLVQAAVLALRYAWRMSIFGASRRIEYEMRNDYFAHLQRMHLGFFHRTRTGDLMARAVNDLSTVQRFLGPGLMHGFSTVVTFAIAVGFMLTVDLRLTLVMMFILPLVSLTFILLAPRIHARFELVQDQFSAISARAQENFSGIRVVKAFAQEPYEIEAFAALNREYIRRNLGVIKTSGALWPLIDLFLGLAAVVLLWQGGEAVITRRITIGQFVQFTAYLGLLAWPMVALGWVVNLMQRGLASMKRLDEIFAQRPAIVDHPDAQPMPSLRGEIEFQNLTFAYHGVPVLREINLRIPAGYTVAVVGPTGSGKSTLVSLIPRLFDVTEGRLLIDGVDVRRIRLDDLRRQIGFVPQDTFLFSETLRENIAYGLDHSGDGVVERAAEISALVRDAEGFPRGYDTVVGERGVTLSGGQKQRAAIARAVARDPRILILDDALSSVDTHTEEEILTRLREVMATRTAILISHRISTVRHADLIVVLDGGRIVEQGRHDELLARGGLYADLYQRQLLEEELAEA